MTDITSAWDHARLVVPMLMALLSVGPLFGQTLSSNGKLSDQLSVRSKQPTSPSGLEATLDALMKTTAQVGKQIGSSSSAPVSQQPSFSAPWNDESPSAGHAPLNVGDIRERIRLLKRLRQQTSSSAVSSQAGSNPAHAAAPSSVARPESHQYQNDSTLSAIEQNLQPRVEPGSEPKRDASQKSFKATQILATPVDHLRLGQSLYRTKNYAAALKALRRVDTDLLTESDRIWLELLLALCQRRVGDLDTAEARLREIANAKSQNFAVPVARWWLKQTEITRDAKSILEQTSEEVNTLIESSRNHDKH